MSERDRERLELSVKALEDNPHITDEQLSQILGLSRELPELRQHWTRFF